MLALPLLALLLVGLSLLPGCTRLREKLGLPCASYDFGLPAEVRLPDHPDDVCLTPARVELGRHLFFDKRLSGNQTQACGSCHKPELAFTDGLRTSIGSTGQTHPRNAQALANVGSFRVLTWLNPTLHRLDNQTLIPFFSTDSESTIEELAITNKEWMVTKRLMADPAYPPRFAAAFPGRRVDITTIARALAAFQTTLISQRSPYDLGTMNASARRGQNLFESNRTGCSSCHGGLYFNEDSGRLDFQNVGLYNVAGKGDYPDHKLHGKAAGRALQGLFATSEDPDDRGKFRTPSLRNLSYTAPYMHDGSIATLEAVIEHFNAGGRNLTHGPLRGDGRQNPNKDPRVRALHLSAGEKADLLAFLLALNDECFVTNPRHQDPTAPARPAAPGPACDSPT